jgi:hypothetical protein
MGGMPRILGYSLRRAETRGARIELNRQGLTAGSYAPSHVIVATGYRLTLRSLRFLGEHLVSAVQLAQQTPVLSSNFESSVSALHFTGWASANQFGPVMRLLPGADLRPDA